MTLARAVGIRGAEMPTYEYVCTACAHQWEELQKITEPALDTCPKCAEKTARRQISAGNFILKGGGWYADLYSSSSKSGSGGESKTEAKAETKTETKSEAPASAAPAAPAASSPPAAGGDKK